MKTIFLVSERGYQYGDCDACETIDSALNLLGGEIVSRKDSFFRLAGVDYNFKKVVVCIRKVRSVLVCNRNGWYSHIDKLTDKSFIIEEVELF